MGKAVSEFYNLVAAGKAWFVLERLSGRRVCVAVVSETEFDDWRDNLLALGQRQGSPQVHLFPSGVRFERLETLNNLIASPAGIVLTTAEALEEKTVAPGDFHRRLIELVPGKDYEFNRFTAALTDLGYGRVDFVEEKGQFSRRGEVLDIWSPDQELPWRLVFNHNALESLRPFEVGTQRSSGFLPGACLLPVRETREGTLAEYLPPDTLMYFDAAPDPSILSRFHAFAWVVNNPLAAGPDGQDADFRGFPRWAGNFQLFLDDLRRLEGQGYRVSILCSNQGDKERLEDVLAEHRWRGVAPEMSIGSLTGGFYSPSRRLAVFSAQEILYQRKPVSFPKFKSGRRLEGLWEIAPGDFVVHERHGIGRYLGLRKISRGDQESEYLCLEYKGGDKLYVPIDDFRVVQKYVGLEGQRPRLYSLDTVTWERAKQRAKESAQKLAAELLKLYAERQQLPGQAYAQDNHWERELADSFPYDETEDQCRAIEDVKHDLVQPRPMERIICGDVGFGKTEVAIRAAFKVAVNSRQVAVLVPTTVLAEQHFLTFSNRLSPFPVKLAMLSRFQSRADQDKVIADVKAGAVDIVIGTHRLLQKDISFRDLGLLIVDEEHRFGVKQKERIKALKKNVDVLLLSATPIPRTLSLALANIRDLSVIETPPYGRLPIETHLGQYDEDTVSRIIHAELSRGGQVFYVHNRVESIFSRADYLQRLLPDVRLGVIHGQMPAGQIEKTMWEFLHRKIDVLVATTIIESGLDIPSVNTMIIEDAENFGLAQLYQLRGRIGRERRKAYCYLFHSSGVLSDDATRRLSALQEFNDLGSGFRLALRDLEIRGAGNILGAEQHGFVREIGFELYSRLLAEASRTLKGESAPPEETKTVIDFAMPAYLPADYIETEDVRITFYRRLAGARVQREIDAVREELADRFGALPESAANLLALTGLRVQAERKQVKRISEEPRYVAVYFSEKIDLSPDEILALAKEYGSFGEFMRGESPGIRFLKDRLPEPTAVFLGRFLSRFKTAAVVR